MGRPGDPRPNIWGKDLNALQGQIGRGGVIKQMGRKNWLWMIVVVLVMVATVAYADDTSSEIGKTIDSIWSYLWKVIGIALAGLVAKAISKLANKYGIELSETRNQQISDYTIHAIGYAEEWAAKKIKDKVKISSEDKFDKAVEKLSDKVPYLTEAQIREWVISTLPKFRAFIETKVPK